jgi:hypothetical protein
MVVILRDAALVFWMEYRRYVRTRRYWVLALTTLALGVLLCLIAALVAARIPQAPLRFLGASVYLPATIVGWFAAIASVVHNPLSVRMLQDVYKTRPLTDLYLTELHPLGVVLGRAAATTALTGLILLMLTPAGLWLLQLIGAPLGAWVPIALLALVSYFFGSCLDAYTFRIARVGRGAVRTSASRALRVCFDAFTGLLSRVGAVFIRDFLPAVELAGAVAAVGVHAADCAVPVVRGLSRRWVGSRADGRTVRRGVRALGSDCGSAVARLVVGWGVSRAALGRHGVLAGVRQRACGVLRTGVRSRRCKRRADAVSRTDHRDAAQPFGRAVDGLLWRRASSKAAAVRVALSVGRSGVAVGTSLARGRRALPCGRAGVGRVGRADEVALLDDLLLGSVRAACPGS